MPNLRSLDPRPKMMMLICLSTTALFSTDLRWLAGLAVFTVMILLGGGVCLNKIVSQAKTASGFIVFLFLLQCLFNRTGNALIEIGRFTMVTDKGIITAAILALRLLIFLLSALILFTGEARDYLLALIQCRIPYEIAFMVMIGIHFFPILREEAFNVYCSAQLRGTEIKKASLSTRLSAYLHLCLPILVGALKRAKSMSVAMEAKCFRAFPERTYLRRLTLATKDKVCLVLFPLGMAVVFFC